MPISSYPVYGTYNSCGNYYREEDFVLASEEIGKEGLKALNETDKTIADSSVWGNWPKYLVLNSVFIASKLRANGT